VTQYTPNRHLPYPELGDTADVPRDVKALATALDSATGGAGGSGLVLSQRAVRDTGQLNQVRAGRVLTAADFTALGLSAPAGLWNLGDLTDASGNGRVLSNKGGVPFVPGIMGAPIEAAGFAGSTGQALYIADTGAADPFRIRTGSFGCWFRTAKRGTAQALISKWKTSVSASFLFYVQASNSIQLAVSLDGTTSSIGAINAVSDVCDDRWHFAVATADATALRLYIDGALEAKTAFGTLYATSTAALNIGASDADASTAANSAHYGRVDEAFVTADVLTDDQVRGLYSARIVHGLVDSVGAPIAPTNVTVNVRRKRRGQALAVSDFPAQPARLYNFTGGSLNNQGVDANGAAGTTASLAANGSAPSVSGADGSASGAFSFTAASSQTMSATDTGLPNLLTARSYGCWFKTSATGAPNNWGIISWGTTAAIFLSATPVNGNIICRSGADDINGPVVNDGQWHFAVAVEDNTAPDAKRKLYLDGRLVGGSVVLNSITLGGANRFRVGGFPDGTLPFTGQIDGAFVSALALTAEQVRALYDAGTAVLQPSPKDAADHVEALASGGVLTTFDSLETADQIDVGVS